MAEALRFFCLDPRKAKRATVERTLSPLGQFRWLKVPPMRVRGYPETRDRAAAAFETATKKPAEGAKAAAKRALLRLQYNGARALFEANRDAVAVAWNGLNGTRRVYMDGARDAGARTLYFELCPFPGRVTVDPCGVNFQNGLPRDGAFYLDWAKDNGAESWRTVRETIRARTRAIPREETAGDRPLTEPFVFVPLQVPGDSQLRLFGGAFRTVEAVIEAMAEAAKRLPDGWHLRLKEHPTSPVAFGDLIDRLKHPKLVLDNATDTFAQVAASRAVVTVNSSVGLEAMFYEKPVVALGQCFWAIPGIAGYCPTPEALSSALSDPGALSFDPATRAAFLSFLADTYYPMLNRDAADGTLHPDEAAKVTARLHGPDPRGLWACTEALS
jgi:capsular polysaccharide export protein